GKTLTALWITQLWKSKKTIVICPRTAFNAWKRDITKYTDFSYVILEGEKAVRIKGLETEYQIYIINYEGLKSIYADLKLTSEDRIDTFDGEYAFMSNFHSSTIYWDNERWPTLEHAFQAAKSTDSEVQKIIRNADTPGEAKKLGRKVRLSFCKDWDEYKLEVMQELVEKKFLQDINLTKALLNTKEAKLTEGNYWHDNFWGDCYCKKCSSIKGLNNLGKILMATRKKLGGEGAPKRAWLMNFTAFIDHFDNVIFDEVHKCTSNTSIQAKICYQLSHRAKNVIGMTGTPISSHLLNLWNIMKVIDLGMHLGLNFFVFRNKYFKKSWHDWIPFPNSEKKILERIAPVATSFKREECIDLPEKMYEPIVVEASTEQRKAMDKVIAELTPQINSGLINQGNVLTKTQKLREIAGGFLYSTNKKGKRETYIFPKNPKLEVIEDVVTSTDYKIIIFHQFEAEGRIMENWAKNKKIGFASMRGEIKDTEAEFDRFINDEKVQILIAHPKSASESLDMTITFIEVFYSTGSFLEREQAEGRTRRKHQHKKQLYIDVILRNSPDEIGLERIKETKKLSERVLEFIRNYGKKGVDGNNGKATLFD
ncbi:MAG: NADAR domain-containing protein, partial [Nitrosopumilus sp.]